MYEPCTFRAGAMPVNLIRIDLNHITGTNVSTPAADASDSALSTRDYFSCSYQMKGPHRANACVDSDRRTST